ncbi:hypothetical protein Ahy_A06g030069 [Arachis hypogaea]|uniref:Uncharacterized protein n=1 Tax=Arachis hypogaea TaxID=3818 RepID=A0A445CV45_ARAHY|nr:hypothetical protein Ahy_A06g030069 [Arachis hypogaea]
MATSKRSTSSWSRRGGRHGGSNGNGLKYAENSKEKLPHCKFFAWIDQLFDINLDYDCLEDVAMDFCETAGHVSHMFAANIAGLEHKVMELQSRVDMLEIHQNVVPEIEWKTRCFNVVFVIIMCVLLVLVMGVGIASL